MSNEELAIKIQQGHREYMPALFDQVKKLLCCKARNYFKKFSGPCSRSGTELDDLYQEAFMAMLDAVREFKPGTEYCFTTYLSFPLKNRFNALTNCGRCKPNPLNEADSLDEPLPNADGSLTLGDVVPDEGSAAAFDGIDTDLYQTALHSALEKSMEHLVPEQHATVKYRYYENKTREQIGEAMHCSSDQVRQYEAKALRALRNPKITRTLKPFLFDELESSAYRGTGLQSFKNTGASATERAAEHMEKLERLVMQQHSAGELNINISQQRN